MSSFEARKFGGKLYHCVSMVPVSKGTANTAAGRRRASGDLARVVKVNGGYVLYVR